MSTLMNSLAGQVEKAGGKFRYSTSVVHVEQPSQGGWDVTTYPGDPADNKVVSSSAPLPSFVEGRNSVEKVTTTTKHFDKIVVATGAFSTPSVPSCALPHLLQPTDVPKKGEGFTIHSSDVSRKDVQATLDEENGLEKVVVVGASKSAFDIAVELSKVRRLSFSSFTDES
jgi:glycine/D-amino acid oxidase-like deaminating enzyme